MILTSKVNTLNKFNEDFEKLNDTDKNNFSYACNKLLNTNFIYGQSQNDENTYRLIRILKDLIEAYFFLIDFELVHDDNYKIFFLRTNADHTRLKLKKTETVILLILAKLYKTESLDLSSGDGIEVTIQIDVLLEELEKTKIFNYKLSKTEVLNALATLKRHTVIRLNKNTSNQFETITILPTILYVVKDHNIDLIKQRLDSFKLDQLTSEGSDEDETNED